MNVWYFGYNAGLNFNTGTPTPLTDGALSIWEGCATICDENGNPLFYTDGRSIWNKNHLIMPNATNLGGDNSSSQSGIIVPQPENPNRYFVFSVDAEGGSGGVQYAVVDITLNNGLGGLISKNTPLLSRASEKLTAVRHCNNKDFWVIAHELNNNSFRAYLVTRNGLSATSFESKVGNIHNGGTGAIGYMKASNNGRKIAVCTWLNGTVELLDFDNTNGTLSNVISIQNARMRYAYGAEFSPNNQYLYVSTPESRIIHQFEVNVSNSASFASSRVEIGGAPLTGASKIGALQIAPNNLIYIALDNTQFLGVINNPDAKGTACNYVEKGVFLSGKYSGIGLPNLITTYFKEPLSVTTSISKGNDCNDITLSAKIVPNLPNLAYQWFLDDKPINGANQVSFKPTVSGSYFVSIKESGQCINDSTKSSPTNIFILKANPQIVNTACGSVQLKANANSVLKWSGSGISANKEMQDTLTVSSTGTQVFKVQVFNPMDNNCFIEKEITVNFSNASNYSFGKSAITACDTITLAAPTNSNWNSYVWSLPDGTTVNSNRVLARQSGRYTITVKNSTSSCEAKDNVILTIGKTPTIKPDENFCLSTNSITIDAGATGNNLIYEWTPGSANTAGIIVNSAGKYHVKATSPEGCSASRNIEVFLKPNLDLGNDITVCEGQTVELKSILNNTMANLTYRWSTGETTPSIKPNKSGVYSLTIQHPTCQASDSVKVNINSLPKIKADETICLDKVIDAGGLENNLTYEWQDLGDTRPTIEVSNEGVYKVKISNQFGCSLIRTITVTGPCNARIYAPDVFTPNGDNINDVFKVILVGGSIVRLDIFNRWGNIIYSEENTNPQWNGEFKGSICLNGAYAYVLSYKTLQDNLVHEYRGKVLLQK